MIHPVKKRLPGRPPKAAADKHARNVMTPVRFAVLRLRVRVWVEISLGDFLDKPIYGVTLFDTVDPSRDYTHSTCCHSPDELRTVLLAIKGD